MVMDRQLPNLLIDFVLVGEKLYLRFANISDAEAYDVSVNFSQPILALNQSKDLAQINLFRKLAYFAPQKEFLLYIDEVSQFLSTLEKTTVQFTILCYNAERKFFKKEIIHDLAIYHDLPIILKP